MGKYNIFIPFFRWTCKRHWESPGSLFSQRFSFPQSWSRTGTYYSIKCSKLNHYSSIVKQSSFLQLHFTIAHVSHYDHYGEKFNKNTIKLCYERQMNLRHWNESFIIEKIILNIILFGFFCRLKFPMSSFDHWASLEVSLPTGQTSLEQRWSTTTKDFWDRYIKFNL